jgi:23S rRNA (uracil1939-C5)-methyltransferase
MPMPEAPSLSVGSEHEVRFTDLLANGQGVARIGSLVVFVWGPLPGERARIRLSEVKKSYAVGELVEILERSPDRAAPFCPVFGTCGGCQVQHLAYEAQLAWKAGLLREALERIGGFRGVAVQPTIGMDEPRAYRNKMALVVRQDGDRTDFGFYQMRSHDFVPIAGCPVVLPQLDEQIAALRRASADDALKPAFGGVEHAIARAGFGTGESVLALTTRSPSQTLGAKAAGLAARLRGVVGISNSYEPRSANAVLGRKHRTVWGRDEMEERIPFTGGVIRYRVSAASFFQVNSVMLARVFELLSGLSRPRKVVDLYCGAGTFSIWFALRGADVVGVEENPSAIREARANAALNGVEQRARFLSGRVEAVLRRPPGAQALRDADLVFLDPPRKGSDVQTLDALAAAKVPAVWYLSCNPATLARDLARLREAGYTLESVQPYDFFPQTGSVESLTLLRRASAVGARDRP